MGTEALPEGTSQATKQKIATVRDFLITPTDLGVAVSARALPQHAHAPIRATFVLVLARNQAGARRWGRGFATQLCAAKPFAAGEGGCGCFAGRDRGHCVCTDSHSVSRVRR